MGIKQKEKDMHITQLLVARFNTELPDSLITWLNEMTKDTDNVTKPFNHRLFKTKRWELLGRESDVDLSNHHFVYKDNWLYVNSTLKEYDDEYDKFIDLLDPYTNLIIDVRHDEDTYDYKQPFHDDHFYKVVIKGVFNLSKCKNTLLPSFIKELMEYANTDKLLIADNVSLTNREYQPILLADLSCTVIPLQVAPKEMANKMYLKTSGYEYIRIGNGKILQWCNGTTCNWCLGGKHISITHKAVNYLYDINTWVIIRQ